MRWITVLMIGLFFMTACASGDEYYVPLDDVTDERIARSIEEMGDYLLRQVHGDGSMIYKFLPESGEYPAQNNMIRQFMATHALGELSMRDGRFEGPFMRNVRFNLAHFYKEEESFGYIHYNGMTKLGSAAIASIALQHSLEHLEEKRQLIAFMREMHLESGRFRTFYHPEGVDRNHNFYPGEAMFALMVEYEQTGDRSLLPIVQSSALYYRDIFRSDPNPAFVPWQTMAQVKLYAVTGDRSMADFVFEMNDFLIDIQHTSCLPDKRYLGRFYDPKEPGYGPPHSSSTAIYIEGLTYAYELAKMRGDTIREARYRNAILLGARSILQLQFTDENIWPVSEEIAPLVSGGIRKTVLDPELRIDNTQHAVMAFLRILEVMDEDDYSAFRKDMLCC